MSSAADPVVRLEGIDKRFGTVVANDDIDFALQPGTIHALLGENGSGKTTLMSILYGLYEADAGLIEVRGEPRDFESPRDAIDAGIGMIHQEFQLVDTMTVLENIVLGHEPGRAGLVDQDAAEATIVELSEEYGFDADEYLDVRIDDLSLGIRQRIEIVKSLYRGAEILILDEPTAVLTPQEVDRLFKLMDELRADGASLIFITHKLEEALAIADEISVLRDGRKVGTVDAESATKEELARMMVGREVIFEYEDREAATGDPVLDIEDLRVRGDRGLEQVSRVDLQVRQGEILGIAGVQGNGQSELVEAVTGLREVVGGTVRFQGEDITHINRRDAIESGIAFIPENRLAEGLVLDYDLVRNSLLGFQTLSPFVSRGVLDWPRIREHARSIVDEFAVQPPNPNRPAFSFSGGNQQKFVVGRELSHDPELLVAAHPTRGVDIGSIEFIHQRLLDMRSAGLPILLVSSKLDEIQQLSDRIAVMFEGEIVATVQPGDVTEEDLGLLMAGEGRDAIGAPAADPAGGGEDE